MAIYRNESLTTKTFYGVTFKPGDVHLVPGYINAPKFCRLSEMPVSRKSKSAVSSAKPTKHTTKSVVADNSSESKINKNSEEVTV